MLVCGEGISGTISAEKPEQDRQEKAGQDVTAGENTRQRPSDQQTG